MVGDKFGMMMKWVESVMRLCEIQPLENYSGCVHIFLVEFLDKRGF
jgi:hypothetical protein